jgi:molybdenum cofactor biosynthesis enzyme MoaA
MRYNGYLDTNDGWMALGWAYDSERPYEPVEVDFKVGNQHVCTLMADEFRPDLQIFGNGRHGFSFGFPLEVNVGENLTAQIKGTNFVLKGSPMRQKNPRESIARIAGDIVNQCNLRCPFCIVDYTNFGSLSLMTSETFDRVLELLPITSKGNFWLSCLHEPTMHPQFIDFIERVPQRYRNRISFTTNLSKRLPPDMLERLADSGIHEIRVSLDTQCPELFSELRKKGKYRVFEQNLLALSAALRTSKQRPLLHLISMAFRDNYRELPELVRVGRDLGADSHEIRYIYYVPHLAGWGKDHILNTVEWAEMEALLLPLASPTLAIAGPMPETQEKFKEEQGVAAYIAPKNFFGGDDNPAVIATPNPNDIGFKMPDEALLLRLRWDGMMTSEQVPEDIFRVNLNNIEQPAGYFELVRLASRRSSGKELSHPKRREVNGSDAEQLTGG